jgi:hypothetical protein
MAIVNAQIKDTTQTVLTVDAGKSYAITNILVCNNGTTDAQFDLHLVPNGVPVDDFVTRVINNLPLPAGETFTFDNEKIVLEEGDSIVYVGDPGTINDPAGAPGNTDFTVLSTTISYLEV